jgi:hypothetical protein
MRQRFRLYRRKKGGRYYIHDGATGKQDSVGTTDRAKALRLLHARNEAQEMPAINLQIAKAYLAAADESFVNRTWREVMDEFVKLKTGSNRTRSERAVMDKAFDSIRDLQLLETRSEHFLRVLGFGKVSTNNYLRRFHNFAADMGWLPWPVLPKRQWPAIHYKEKRAVTREEHELILSREHIRICGTERASRLNYRAIATSESNPSLYRCRLRRRYLPPAGTASSPNPDNPS